MAGKLTVELLLEEGYKTPTYQAYTDAEKEEFKASVISLFNVISEDIDKPFTNQNILKTLTKYLRHQLDNGLVDKMVKEDRTSKNPKFASYSDSDLKIYLSTLLTDQLETYETLISQFPSDDSKEGWLLDAFTQCQLIMTYKLRGEAVELLRSGKLTLGDYFRLNADQYLF